jgi:hypothetical protein
MRLAWSRAEFELSYRPADVTSAEITLACVGYGVGVT